MNKNNKLAFFSDLDGTLLNNTHQFSDYTKEMVDNIQKNGHYFVVTTGRLIGDAISQAKQLGLDKHKGFVIGNNGAALYSFRDNKFLWEMHFTNQEVKNLYEFAGQDFKLNLFGQKTVYVNKKGKNSLYWAKVMNANYNISSSHNNITDNVYNGVLLSYKDLTKAEANKVIADFRLKFPFLDIKQYSNRVFDISCKNISKGTALLFLSHHLNVYVKDTFSFGDSYNDLEMIEVAGNGIAVTNAIEDVLVKAKKIVGSNDEDGVAKFLKEII